MCDFRGATFRGASSRGASFSGCDLTDADLRDTDLTGVRLGRVLTGTPPPGQTVATGVQLDGAVIRDLHLDQVIGWPAAD